VTAVDFGSVAATTYSVLSPTELMATSPGGTGTVDVTVTTSTGTTPIVSSDQFTYVPAPSVTSVSPATGPATGGTSVTITGTNLEGPLAVYFGQTAATTYHAVSDTEITATSPAGTGTVDITVVTDSGFSSPVSSASFTYAAVPVPAVTGISPTSGPTAGGTVITITGSGFTGATAVYFGTTPATDVSVTSDTSITATSPAGSGTVNVTVVGPGGTSPTTSADQFTYTVAPPAVTVVSPASGPAAGGTTVSIAGSGFTGATAVDFGSTPATSFAVVNDNLITAVTPAGTDMVNVTVVTPAGTSAVTGYDHFSFLPAPVVSLVFPGSGPAAGFQLVFILGQNLTGVSGVDFGTQPALFRVLSSVVAVALAPPSTTGPGVANVTMTGPGGTSAIASGDHYTYESGNGGAMFIP